MEFQMVNKDNEAKREKMIANKKVGDMERERQQLVEVRTQLERLKDTNGSLQREIVALHEVISEQKVR